MRVDKREFHPGWTFSFFPRSHNSTELVQHIRGPKQRIQYDVISLKLAGQGHHPDGRVSSRACLLQRCRCCFDRSMPSCAHSADWSSIERADLSQRNGKGSMDEVQSFILFTWASCGRGWYLIAKRYVIDNLGQELIIWVKCWYTASSVDNPGQALINWIKCW